MRDVIVLIVFGSIFAWIAFLTRNAGKKPPDLKTAEAVIDRSASMDGATTYYVSLFVDGKILRGESVPYSTSTKQRHAGEHVTVEYYFTKRGWPFVYIVDDRLKTCEEASKNTPIIVAGIALAFYISALILYLKTTSGATP